MDAFTRALGTEQGRVEGVGFVLGHLTPGFDANLVPGNYAEVTQQVDLTGIDVVRVRGRFEHRGGRWALTIRVDGQERTMVEASRTRRALDLGADVRGLTGLHEVTVRLVLLAP
jgi:hypothetical protein